MKKNLRFHLYHLMTAAIFVSLFSLVIVYIIVYRWQVDGLSVPEISLMSIICGVVVFTVSIVGNGYFELAYLNSCDAHGIKPVKFLIQATFISFYTCLLIFGLDYLYSISIDNSIQNEYAVGLKELIMRDGKDDLISEVGEFQELPFFLQNGFLTFIFCFVSNLISIPIGKKIRLLISKQS